MKDYTVYRTVAKDGIIRMALHPMDSAPNFHHYHYAPEITWPFRVVFCLGRKVDLWDWYISCRGKDSYEGFTLARGLTARESEYAALEWLLEGEEQ